MPGTLIGNLFVDLIARTAQFQKGMARARRTLRVMSARMKKFGRSMTRIGRGLAMRVTLPVTLFAAHTLKAAGDFEQSMKIVEAKSGAAGAQLEALRQRALEMGREGKVSAKQAADGLVVLVRAGLSAKQAFDALPKVVNFAAASGRSFADAAGTAVDTMGQFGLGVKDITRISDTMVKAANSANQEVFDIAESMKHAGPIAKKFGLDLEETTAIVTLMAKAGIRGGKAGRALAQGMIKIVNPTEKAKKVFKKLNVNIFNASGRFRGFTKILDELRSKGLSGAEALRIFQKRAGVGMISVLDQGGKALTDLVGKLKEAGGTSAKEASKRLEGFNGAMRRLSGAFEALQIAIADAGLLEFAKNLVLRLRDLLVNLSETNPELLQIGTILAVVAAALGPVLIIVGQLTVGLGLLLPWIVKITVALAPLTLAAVILAAKIALIAGAVIGLIVLFGQFQGLDPSEALAGFFENVKNALKFLRKGLGNMGVFLTKMKNDIVKKFTEIGKAVADTVGPALAPLKKGVMEAFAVLRRGFENMGSFLSKMKDDIVAKFREIFEGASEWTSKTAKAVKENLVGKLEAVKKKLGSVLDGIKAGWGLLSKTLVGNSIIPDMMKRIKDLFLRMGVTVLNSTKVAAKGVTGVFKKMGAGVVKNLGDVATKVKKKLSSLFERKKKKRKLIFPGEDKPKKKKETIEEKARRANKALLALGDAARRIGKAMTESLGKALDDFVDKGKFSMSAFRNFAASALKDVAKGLLREGILGPRGTGRGGLLGALGGLFRFQRGGSFTVGGAGGADSQLVAFRATPGEEVSIRRPGQLQGVGVQVNQNFAMGVAQTVRAELAAMRPQMEAGIANAVADKRMRGGAFSVAMTGRT